MIELGGLSAKLSKVSRWSCCPEVIASGEGQNPPVGSHLQPQWTDNLAGLYAVQRSSRVCQPLHENDPILENWLSFLALAGSGWRQGGR